MEYLKTTNQILKTIKLGILQFMLDEELSILWANDCFYRISGYSEEEYKRRFSTMRQYYKEAPDDFNQMKEVLFAAVNNGETEAELDVCLPKNGSGHTYTKISVSIIKNETGAPPICSAVYQFNGLENPLSETNSPSSSDNQTEYFEWMLDEYVGNAYISDIDNYELLYLNKTACDTLGVTPEKIVGRKCYEVIQGRTEPCPFCTNARLRRDEFYEWEFFNPNLDRTFLIKNRMISWRGHKARLELSHDNYSLEYKLAKKDREREAILRTIPGGLARLDARDMSTILWYGAGYLTLIGYTKDQFEHELHAQLNYIHPEDKTRLIQTMGPAKEIGENIITEARIVTRNGDTKILTITLSYVSGEESWDGIPSFYSVGIDVTKDRQEQARQRKALEEAYQTAHVASAAKTNFLSSMSHDIRTPMNAIMGMAAIAQSNLASPDKVRDCLNKINVSSRHLLGLINEVLDMSKIENGKIDLIPEEVDMSDLVQSVADMCRPLVVEKNQQFRMSVGRVQHEKVVADGDRLRQVLMNLLSNAVKYTPEGGIIDLRIDEMYSPVPNKSQYEFTVIDNGIGMPADYIPHLFEPFSRAEDSRISKIQGTGLGMAITENIVRMMNGTIQVHSALGKGSTFTVSVPLEWCQEEEDNSGNLTGLPVLVVDDDQIVCENATALLDELGMRGYWVLTGAEAVSRVVNAHEQSDDFFAVILDWKMPEMDGLDTLRAIRANLGEDVPIIIISAYDYSDIEDEFLRAGADAFITKPLFKSKMLHVLQLFLSADKDNGADTAGEETNFVLYGKRVLLAEDNDLNREIATELLRMQNLIVDSVENGQRAVEVFENSEPGYYSAILMDIQMPVMNGYDATQAIRASNKSDAKRIPILALTANAFAADVGKARNVGMNDHIAKPIDIGCLVETLKKWMS